MLSLCTFSGIQLSHRRRTILQPHIQTSKAPQQIILLITLCYRMQTFILLAHPPSYLVHKMHTACKLREEFNYYYNNNMVFMFLCLILFQQVPISSYRNITDANYMIVSIGITKAAYIHANTINSRLIVKQTRKRASAAPYSRYCKIVGCQNELPGRHVKYTKRCLPSSPAMLLQIFL